MAEKDILTGQDKDTLLQGHDADGITEFDNDMPLWWLVGFIFTVVFAFGYLVQYHLSEGPSSQKEYEQEVADFNQSKGLPGVTQEEVALDPLTDFASLDAGKIIFNGAANTCFTCHRNDLGGIVGPNLTDEFWIHGGNLKAIMKSIKTGYPEKGMQPFGTNARLSERQVLQVASFILSMKDSHPANPKPIDPTREVKWEEKHEEGKEEHDKGEKKDRSKAAGEKNEKHEKAEKKDKK
jgi:cytochrome c oxidase cbb3-type subunit 3